MLVSIKEKAKELGVSIATLRRWDKNGLLSPEKRTFGGHRRYKVAEKVDIKDEEDERLIVGYARVSSHDQTKDLETQKATLLTYKTDVLLSDIGSGLNFKKSGFNKLMTLLLKNKVKKIIITHKDRLLRFGFEMIERICQHKNVDIFIIYEEKENSFEKTLIQDLISIITVFSSKLYGKRSHKNKKKLLKTQYS